MKKKLIIIAFSAILTGCNTAEYSVNKAVGSDRDRHGCISSAGYVWSNVKKDCIRIFEVGYKLYPINSKETLSTFVVFADDDNSAELFLPGKKKHPILNYNGSIWKNRTYTLIKKGDILILKYRGRNIYTSSPK